MYSHAPSRPAVPTWYFLLGLSFGHVLTSRNAVPYNPDAWQSIVNILVVPIYSIAVFFYLVSKIWTRMVETKRQPKMVHPPIIIAPRQQEGKVNMNGSFKLTKNDNFDGFLAAQGIPWALRRAADQARPTHSFRHEGDIITIKITGIIESQTTYVIGGPPKETCIRGRVFLDTLEYIDDGICSRKKAITEDYDLVVTRVLAEDGMSLTMTSKAVFHDERDDIVCIQLFQRIE
jgi:hypothetical protein